MLVLKTSSLIFVFVSSCFGEGLYSSMRDSSVTCFRYMLSFFFFPTVELGPNVSRNFLGYLTKFLLHRDYIRSLGILEMRLVFLIRLL